MPKLRISQAMMSQVDAAIQTTRSTGDSLPIVYYITARDTTSRTFDHDEALIALEHAQASLMPADTAISAYVLIAHSEVEWAGDAVETWLIECAERTTPKGWRFLYRHAADSPMEGLVYLGTARNLLLNASS